MTGLTSQEQNPPETRAPNRRSRLIMGGVVGAIILLFVIVPGILMATTPHPHGTLYDNPVQVADFTLPMAGGGTFQLSDYRGKVVVLYFGYTSCPDVCPTTLYDLRRTIEALEDDADEVVVVFVTIDPEVDTPEKIVEYLGYFHPSFIGLYGTETELEALQEQFDVRVYREDEGETIPGYGITHSTSMFILDREGYLKLRMHHDTDVEYLLRDLKYVIKGRL